MTGFFVNSYLSEMGCKIPYSFQIDLPMSEKSWLNAFEDSNTKDLQSAFGTLYNLGFMLASQNLIVGR